MSHIVSRSKEKKDYIITRFVGVGIGTFLPCKAKLMILTTQRGDDNLLRPVTDRHPFPGGCPGQRCGKCDEQGTEGTMTQISCIWLPTYLPAYPRFQSNSCLWTRKFSSSEAWDRHRTSTTCYRSCTRKRFFVPATRIFFPACPSSISKRALPHGVVG